MKYVAKPESIQLHIGSYCTITSHSCSSDILHFFYLLSDMSTSDFQNLKVEKVLYVKLCIQHPEIEI